MKSSTILLSVLLFSACSQINAQIKGVWVVPYDGPKILTASVPDYPNEAIEMGVGGIVSVVVSIDKGGNASVLRAAGPLAPCHALTDPRVSRLRAAAVAAAKLLKFKPVMKDAKAVETVTTVNFAVPLQLPPHDTRQPRNISAGFMNSKVISGASRFSDILKESKSRKAINVQILVGESGNVLAAAGVSGDPVFYAAAAEAACKATLSPTTLSGIPVKVSGVLVYKFDK